MKFTFFIISPIGSNCKWVGSSLKKPNIGFLNNQQQQLLLFPAPVGLAAIAGLAPPASSPRRQPPRIERERCWWRSRWWWHPCLTLTATWLSPDRRCLLASTRCLTATAPCSDQISPCGQPSRKREYMVESEREGENRTAAPLHCRPPTLPSSILLLRPPSLASALVTVAS